MRAVLAETLRCPRPWGRHTAASSPSRPRLPPGAEKALAHSLARWLRGAGAGPRAVGPAPASAGGAARALQGRRMRAAGRGGAGAGQGGARAQPYLALTHGWRRGCLPRVGRGGDAGKRCGAARGLLFPDCQGRGIYLGRPFLPSEAGRTTRASSSQALPESFPHRPPAPSPVPWEGFLPSGQVWLFSPVVKEACQTAPPSLPDESLVWGLPWGLGRTSGDSPPQPSHCPFQLASVSCKMSGWWGRFRKKEWPERAK